MKNNLAYLEIGSVIVKIFLSLNRRQEKAGTDSFTHHKEKWLIKASRNCIVQPGMDGISCNLLPVHITVLSIKKVQNIFIIL